jgi:hypothetical protein
MKLKNLLFGLTIFFSGGLFAQTTALLVSTGYKIGPTFYKGFGRLADNYNQANPTNKTKLSNFGASSGFWYSIDAVLNGVYMGFYHHSTNARAASEISDYKSRRFDLNYKVWGMDFGGGMVKDHYGIIGFGGIYFGTANISAYYKYFDGYKSLGSESSINGIYHGFGFAGSLGIKTFWLMKKLGFTAGLRWTPIGGASLGFSDYGGGAGKSLSENWGGYGTAKELQPTFSTLSLDLGIAIKLTNN